MAIDRAKWRDLAAQALAGAAPRPAVTPADRSAVKAVAPEPPATWSAPPAATRGEAPAEATRLPDRPVAFSDRHAALLHSENKPLPRPRTEVTWERYDLQTGQRLDRPVLLWPWLTDPTKPPDPRQPPPPPTAPSAPLAALTADGERLAACDPANPGRVDVWTAGGKHRLGFYPAAPKQAPDWLGWGADGRLLTLAGGTPTAWDVPAGKAVYEVAGGYAPPVEFAAGRGWLAVAAGSHVDLLDTATGRCLGRCRAGGVTGPVQDVGVSPDGRRLAAAFLGAPVGRKEKFTAAVWDLTTGRADLAPFGTGADAVLSWAGPEQLLACADRCELFDLHARSRVAVYNFPTRSGHRVVEPLLRSPDGRLWVGQPGPVVNRRVWKVLNVPGAQGETDDFLLADDRESLVLPKLPLRIEADLGTAERSRTFGRNVAGKLQKQAFTIGPNGWTLQLSHKVADSGQVFNVGAVGPKGTPIPMVQFTWRLLSPEGTEVWKEGTAGLFLKTASKYFVKSKHGMFAAMESPGAVAIDYYAFGGRDMAAAIVEEILDHQAEHPVLPHGPPRWLLKAGGAYHTLPLNLDLLPAAGPDAPPVDPRSRRRRDRAP